MAAVYFAGDLHLDHKNICKFRDFSSVEEHNNTIKENYHKVVTKRDKIYLMGDIAFSKSALAEIKTWPGTKVLIAGNHDFKEAGITMKDLCEVYDEIYGFIRYKDFWLSHCPIHPEELRGRKNIHGHVHSFSLQDDNYFNTSLENIDYTPIELETVRGIFQERVCKQVI